jgi:hypothetical protein
MYSQQSAYQYRHLPQNSAPNQRCHWKSPDSWWFFPEPVGWAVDVYPWIIANYEKKKMYCGTDPGEYGEWYYWLNEAHKQYAYVGSNEK